MKEARVLVAFLHRPELPPLLPVRRRGLNGGRKLHARNGPELQFLTSKVTRFFEKIKQANKESAVILKVRNKPVPFFPNLCGSPKVLNARSKVESGVAAGTPTVPVFQSGGEEGGIQEPCIFEPKVGSARDGGGGSDEEREVVRGGARERGERGVREGGVPRLIKQSPIQPGEDGSVPFVRPGVETIKEGELEEGEVADGFVKRGSQGWIKVVVIFVERATKEVEISDKQPGDVEQRAKKLKLSKENVSEGVVRGSIDISDGEGEAGEVRCEDGGEAETVMARGSEGEQVWLPSG